MLEELREKAKLKRESIIQEQGEGNTKAIDDIIQALNKEATFNKIARSTCFCIFAYLGYEVNIPEFDAMYQKLMAEINKTYTYVNPESLAKKPQ